MANSVELQDGVVLVVVEKDDVALRLACIKREVATSIGITLDRIYKCRICTSMLEHFTQTNLQCRNAQACHFADCLYDLVSRTTVPHIAHRPAGSADKQQADVTALITHVVFLHYSTECTALNRHKTSVTADRNTSTRCTEPATAISAAVHPPLLYAQLWQYMPSWWSTDLHSLHFTAVCGA